MKLFPSLHMFALPTARKNGKSSKSYSNFEKKLRFLESDVGKGTQKAYAGMLAAERTHRRSVSLFRFSFIFRRESDGIGVGVEFLEL